MMLLCSFFGGTLTGTDTIDKQGQLVWIRDLYANVET